MKEVPYFHTKCPTCGVPAKLHDDGSGYEGESLREEASSYEHILKDLIAWNQYGRQGSIDSVIQNARAALALRNR